MKCHTNDNSTSSTQLPHTFSYIVAILGHNHFESPNTYNRLLQVEIKYFQNGDTSENTGNRRHPYFF
jgi:hypothetical protein